MEEPRRGLYLRWEISSSTFSIARTITKYLGGRTGKERKAGK
jgi:hypothetical protein